ncbi:MAG: CoA-transferase subunit beta, partial [Marinobacter sp.]|nr:CoA-transferase subunit beta [Marinobacter sp.]
TGWDIRFADELETTPAPTAEEREVLRDLKARTNAHHSGQQ